MIHRLLPRFSAAALVAALLVLGGCAGAPSGSYVMDPAHGIRKIDPAEISFDRSPARLARRDVLLIQVQPLDKSDETTRIERGNHLQIALEATDTSEGAYRLLPGDELLVEFGDDSDRMYEGRIASDGRLALPRIGRNVVAAGLTLAELNALSEREYRPLYLAPKPSFAVRRSAIDAVVARSGDYPVGSDGVVVIPTVGRFVVLGKTAAEASALIGAQASTRFKNVISATVSRAAVNAREQVDARLTPDGVSMFINLAAVPTRVADDGTVFVPGVGHLVAEGRTAAELRADIAADVSKRYQNEVVVNVSVQDFANDVVYIGGEVRTPGRYPLGQRLSMLRLIAQAGWGNEFADLENIFLLRENGPSDYVVYRTNLQEVVEGKGPGAQDLRVVPQDLVIVPPTGIARANRFVTQYLRGILPFGTNLSYSINRGIGIAQ